MVHGLKSPRKAGAARQALAPGQTHNPEKARSRGRELLQLILQTRKRRWRPPREGEGCLSCMPGCSAHLPWLLFPMLPKEKLFPEAAEPSQEHPAPPKVLFFEGVTTSWANSCRSSSQLLHPTEVPFLCCAPPWEQIFPHAAWAPPWEELPAPDCGTGLWRLVLPVQPHNYSQRHHVQPKVTSKTPVAKTPHFGWKHGRDLAHGPRWCRGLFAGLSSRPGSWTVSAGHCGLQKAPALTDRCLLAM